MDIFSTLLIHRIGAQVADWLAVSASARLLEWCLQYLNIASHFVSEKILRRTNAFLSALSVLAYMVQVWYAYMTVKVWTWWLSWWTMGPWNETVFTAGFPSWRWHDNCHPGIWFILVFELRNLYLLRSWLLQSMCRNTCEGRFCFTSNQR